MRTRSLLSLALLCVAACRPSAFDGLRGGSTPDAPDASDDLLPDAQSAEPLEAAVNDAGANPSDADLMAAADAAQESCPEPPSTPRALVMRGAPRELARLQNPPAIGSRKLSGTAWLGSNRVWLFTDMQPSDAKLSRAQGTPSNYPVAATDNHNYPWALNWTSKAAWTLGDALDARGVPSPLVKVPSSELPTPAGGDVPLMLPSAVIRDPAVATRGIIFLRQSIGFAPPTKVWLADIEIGATVATLREQPLFAGDDPMFSQAAYRGSTYVKLFSCSRVELAPGKLSFPCVLARAPVERVGERAAYEARVLRASGEWDWDANLKLATPVLEGIDSDMSVSFNNHLGQYVLIHSANFSNQLVIHTSASIDGPWTEEQRATLPGPQVAWTNSNGREQPGLVQDCGKRLIVSHWEPTELVGTPFPTAGDVVLSAIDLE